MPCDVPRSWPLPATRCCSRRRPRAGTCSATTPSAGDLFADAVRGLGEHGVGRPMTVGDRRQPRRTARLRRAGSPARVHAWLERPLSSYYLLLGSAGLLVVLGLVMVLSASSVTSLRLLRLVVHRSRRSRRCGSPSGCRPCGRACSCRSGPTACSATRCWWVALALMVLVLVPGVGVNVAGADPLDRASRRAAGAALASSRSSRWCCGAPTCWPARKSGCATSSICSCRWCR